MTEIKRVLRAPEAAKYTGLSESTLAKRRLYGLPPNIFPWGAVATFVEGVTAEALLKLFGTAGAMSCPMMTLGAMTCGSW